MLNAGLISFWLRSHTWSRASIIFIGTQPLQANESLSQFRTRLVANTLSLMPEKSYY